VTRRLCHTEQMEAERTLHSIQDELQVELQSRSAPAFGRFALFFSLSR
jgi:hypothetical protein